MQHNLTRPGSIRHSVTWDQRVGDRVDILYSSVAGCFRPWAKLAHLLAQAGSLKWQGVKVGSARSLLLFLNVPPACNSRP